MVWPPVPKAPWTGSWEFPITLSARGKFHFDFTCFRLYSSLFVLFWQHSRLITNAREFFLCDCTNGCLWGWWVAFCSRPWTLPAAISACRFIAKQHRKWHWSINMLTRVKRLFLIGSQMSIKKKRLASYGINFPFLWVYLSPDVMEATLQKRPAYLPDRSGLLFGGVSRIFWCFPEPATMPYAVGGT